MWTPEAQHTAGGNLYAELPAITTRVINQQPIKRQGIGLYVRHMVKLTVAHNCLYAYVGDTFTTSAKAHDIE